VVVFITAPDQSAMPVTGLSHASTVRFAGRSAALSYILTRPLPSKVTDVSVSPASVPG
jgi:hypothetical protein